MLDPRQPLERGGEVVGGQQRARRAQLVDEQLEPELGGLVLDDEQQLVVLRRVALRLLGGEQEVEPQVVAVRHLLPEVALDAGLEVPVSGLLHAAKVVGAVAVPCGSVGEWRGCQVRVWTTRLAVPRRRHPAPAATRRRRPDLPHRGRGRGGAPLARHPYAGRAGHPGDPGAPAARRGARARRGATGADWALDHVPVAAGRRRRPERLRAAAPGARRDPPAATRTGGWAAVTGSFEALVPSIVEQKVTGKEAFAGFRSLVHFFGERAPGPGRERKLWLQPSRRADPHHPVVGLAAHAHRPRPLPHPRHRRPGRRLARPADARGRRRQAPHPPGRRRVDQRRGPPARVRRRGRRQLRRLPRRQGRRLGAARPPHRRRRAGRAAGGVAAAPRPRPGVRRHGRPRRPPPRPADVAADALPDAARG